jgi:hypothetical protein
VLSEAKQTGNDVLTRPAAGRHLCPNHVGVKPESGRAPHPENEVPRPTASGKDKPVRLRKLLWCFSILPI